MSPQHRRPAVLVPFISALLLMACCGVVPVARAATAHSSSEGGLTFKTKLFSVTLRADTFTIDALQPLSSPPGGGNFSYACHSSVPQDRTGAGNHQLGDVSLRVRMPGHNVLSNHSIHCSDGSGDCIVKEMTAATPAACQAQCDQTTACACWSWGVAGTACYLLSNATSAPVADSNAQCGWKPGWPHATEFASFTSASGGPTPVKVLPTPVGEQIAVDLSPVLPNCPLRVTRHLLVDQQRGDLLVRFDLQNPASSEHRRQNPEPSSTWTPRTTSSASPVAPATLLASSAGDIELGAFGMSMVIDQLFTKRSLEQVAAQCSFSDPAINAQGGYVQVVSTTGKGPVLLVLPDNGASFEAWRLLQDDPTPRGVTFEGFYDMMVHSKAWADGEWAQGGGAWNPATKRSIAPGETYSVQFRMTLAPSLRDVDSTLLSLGRPVVTAVPGFILTPSMSNASVTVQRAVGSVVTTTVTPPGALVITPHQPSSPVKPTLSTSSSPSAQSLAPPLFSRFGVKGVAVGRSVLNITFNDGMSVLVHYFVHPDAMAHVELYASAVSTKYWYTDASDAFKRSPSFLNFDRRLGPAGGAGGQIVQNTLAWISGLSDECGAGPSVGMAMKNLFNPDRSQVRQLEDYVHNTLWGTDAATRDAGWTVQSSTYGVRASMFYSGMPDYNYTCHPCWDRPRSLTKWRSYNYPHVTVVYWALYRLARNYGDGLVAAAPWQWYLSQAVNTTLLGVRDQGGFNGCGLMVGSVWLHLLQDLKAEAAEQGAAAWMTAAVADLEAFMRGRALTWSKLPFPFGSEMPWDSTGQEEVYFWSKYYGFYNASNNTLDAVLAYMPKVPNWGYNGNARRYFDFIVYGGTAPTGTERELHHYGAPLNALVVVDAYKANPDDMYLLHAGLGGLVGSLVNIDPKDGVSSMAWHGSPAVMAPDPTNCDYGVGFYGHAIHAGAFLVNGSSSPSPSSLKFAPLPSSSSSSSSSATDFSAVSSELSCYFCDLVESGSDGVMVLLRDSFHRRLFLSPVGLDFAFESGRFASCTVSWTQRRAIVAADTSQTVRPGTCRLRVELTALPGTRTTHNITAVAWSTSSDQAAKPVPLVRGAYTFDCATKLAIQWSQ